MQLKNLLFISHTPSENTAKLANSCMAAIDSVTEDLIITHKSSGDVVSKDVLACDGLLLATTENIGYMAGLTKDLLTDVTMNGWVPQMDFQQRSTFALVLMAQPQAEL